MYKDSKNNKWYKGNIHTHTTRSDGLFSPEDTIKLYKEADYDFLCLTDHWKWNATTETADMLILSGCEYDFGIDCATGIYHIVAIGCDSEPVIKKDSTPQDAIDAIHDTGGIANLAHPAWSLNSPHELMKLKNVDTTEIFNSISDIPFNCRPYSGIILDIMASRGCVWKLCASDDTHFYKESDTCRSFVYVNAPSCSKDDIMNSLKQGNYYASQGPRLSIEAHDDVLYVETSPADEIVFFTNKAYTSDRCVVGKNITYAEYKIKPEDKFVRIEVKDSEGRYAWSQYYVFN